MTYNSAQSPQEVDFVDFVQGSRCYLLALSESQRHNYVKWTRFFQINSYFTNIQIVIWVRWEMHKLIKVSSDKIEIFFVIWDFFSVQQTPWSVFRYCCFKLILFSNRSKTNLKLVLSNLFFKAVSLKIFPIKITLIISISKYKNDKWS